MKYLKKQLKDYTTLRLGKNHIISEYTTNQNIYITSDEEIKVRDWFYLDDAIIIAKYISVKPVKEAKKIILTTDPDLIKDGVQVIDDEFLEWFVKNPSCEEIEVESNYRVKSGTIKKTL